MSDSSRNIDELIGVTIAGRYRIISRLGAGGMGVAFRAWDEEYGVPVVIKIPKKALLEDPTFAERFALEIRLLQGLTHSHIVPIVDVGEHEGLPYVVMRFLPGGSLSDRRLRYEDRKARPNPPGMLHLWLPALADALDHVHASGVVHRDVKPGNIFFDAFWGAFLGDFGIAKIVEESESFDREHTLTATSMGIGTPDYMAPELFTPKPALDGRVDQYALAVTVYEMLAGTRPFTGTTAHIVVEVTTMPVPRLDRQRSGLPGSLVEAVHRGLAKKPGERFPTCREFAAAVLRDVEILADESDLARLLCPSCSNLLKLPVSYAGRQGKCPKCKDQMEVADDLGALWLLDEARRQRESTASVIGIEFHSDAPGAGSAVDEDSLREFQPVSGTTPVSRSRRQSWPAIFAWIDSHGLAVAGGMTVLTALLWLISAPTPAPDLDRKDAEIRQLSDRLAEQSTQLDDASKAQVRAEDALRIVQADLEAARLRIQELETGREPQPQPPLINCIGMEFKLIPPGAFMMGSDDAEPTEQPVHQVRITQPFYLGIYEVTNAEWKMVMGGDPPSHEKDDNRPVEMVSWNQAVEFCQRLNKLAEERAARRVYRLPKEAEWEYACRAGTTTRWSSGDDPKALEDFAWFDANSGDQTNPVGRKRPNPWGLHDMHGNVWEWCAGWYGPYPGEAVTDPVGIAAGEDRICRGGSSGGSALNSRSANRGKFEPSSRNPALGFRVALSVPAAEPVNRGQQPEGDSTADAPITNIPPAGPEEQAEPSATAQEILARPPLENSVGMKLKLIPPGTFMMGSNDGNPNEKPVHKVRITTSFYLGIYEVTNAEWRRVMVGKPPSIWKEDDRPVEKVSWNDAIAFCQTLSEMTKEKTAGRVYRLPTEAEWEYACRAGTTTRWSSGDDAKALEDFAWFDANSDRHTHPVGQKRANPWGLHDMYGNVYEWCTDWFGSYSADPVSDPTGIAEGSRRVFRGGGHIQSAERCRSAKRDTMPPSVQYSNLGFRVAMSPPDNTPPEAGR